MPIVGHAVAGIYICGLCYDAPAWGPHVCFSKRCDCVQRHIGELNRHDELAADRAEVRTR